MQFFEANSNLGFIFNLINNELTVCKGQTFILKPDVKYTFTINGQMTIQIDEENDEYITLLNKIKIEAFNSFNQVVYLGKKEMQLIKENEHNLSDPRKVYGLSIY